MKAVVAYESMYGNRRQIAEAAEEEDVSVEPGAADGPGLRKWLAPALGRRPAAGFDTRLDRSPIVTGAAARGIAKRLRRRGFS